MNISIVPRREKDIIRCGSQSNRQDILLLPFCGRSSMPQVVRAAEKCTKINIGRRTPNMRHVLRASCFPSEQIKPKQRPAKKTICYNTLTNPIEEKNRRWYKKLTKPKSSTAFSLRWEFRLKLSFLFEKKAKSIRVEMEDGLKYQLTFSIGHPPVTVLVGSCAQATRSLDVHHECWQTYAYADCREPS